MSEEREGFHFVSMGLDTLASRTGQYPKAVVVTGGVVYVIPDKCERGRAIIVEEKRAKYFLDLFELLSRPSSVTMHTLVFAKNKLSESTILRCLPQIEREEESRIA